MEIIGSDLPYNRIHDRKAGCVLNFSTVSYLVRVFQNKAVRKFVGGAKQDLSEDLISTEDDESRDSGEDVHKDDHRGAHLLYDLPSPSVEAINIVSVLNDDIPQDNALHLHLPPDNMPFLTSKSPARNSSADSIHTPEQREQTHALGAGPSNKGKENRQSTFRVRFRSRVRIGSGLRHSQPACSGDSSPSSSISAPLKYNHEDNDDGQLISQSPGAIPKVRPPVSRRTVAKWQTVPVAPALTSNNKNNSDEHTPLLRTPSSRLGRRTPRRCGVVDDDRTRAALRLARAERKREEEAVFVVDLEVRARRLLLLPCQ
ncbi:hypothetical protein EW145_g2029 [Phellinidium pouzarii]|uniref:Uncharacterized protein n=1 Tax=Phellinidium pouzarii TaxID=167371 RepID=A0A4S4LE94_9AGAM|nr:hypothetical protein EW145_g2029 [Phellinidium pouzarii]